MRGYALYLAMRTSTQPPTRCCTDEPVHSETRVAVRAAQRARFRWAIKLARALPRSLRIGRATLREPIGVPMPSVGAKVVDVDGSHLGHVSELLVSLRSGATACSVTINGSPEGHVILISSRELRPTREPDVFVTARGRSPAAA